MADSEQNVFPEWRSFLGSSSDKETEGFIKKVVKRSGEIADYNRQKIEDAIGKAIVAVEGRANPDKAIALTDQVEEHLRILMAGRRAHSIPAIEEIVYRDGKMIFVCENGKRFWYSFATDIVAQLGR